MNENVCAITVSYNPDLELLDRQLSSLQTQCRSVVVDNGSAQAQLQALRSMCGETGAELLSLESNQGIAAAQNRGMAIAREAFPDVEYLFFLDHDSVPDSSMVSAMLDEFVRIKGLQPSLGVLGPVIHEVRGDVDYGFHVLQGLRYRRLLPPVGVDDYLVCATVNSSGSFCPVPVAEKIGTMDETLFIDHVETDWCFRARQAGFLVAGTSRVRLEHRMGDEVMHLRLPGKRLTFPYRSPHRHRYLMRNSIRLLARPYIPLVWKLYCLAKVAVTLAVFGLFSSERWAQLCGIGAGIRDGLLGRGGEISVR